MTAPRLVVLALAASACGFSYAPISDDEVANLGIRQGLAGHAALHSGDCMPGAGLSGNCRYEALKRNLWIIPRERAAALTPAQLANAGNLDPQAIGASVVGLSSGTYGVELPAGTYLPLLIDGSAGLCSSGMPYGVGDASCPVAVETGRVTKLDVVLDQATY
jgi:hypothetical protein